jgi:hypothetical protein
MFFFCFCKKKRKEIKLKKLERLIDEVQCNAKARADFSALVPLNDIEKDTIDKRIQVLHKNYQKMRQNILEIDSSKCNKNTQK